MDFLADVYSETKYINIPYEAASELEEYSHAAHCCIYSLNPNLVMGKYPAKACILMQNRFDGKLGFPGGLIDKEKDIIKGLNRELVEEINFDVDKFAVQKENHCITHCVEERKMCFHLFQKFVTLEDIEEAEQRALRAAEHGHETLGMLRVPLYTIENGVGGLPSFLCNNFCGNARDQLLQFLAQNELLTMKEICNAVTVAKEIISQKNDLC